MAEKSVARRNQQFLLAVVRQIKTVLNEPRGSYLTEEEWGEHGLMVYWGAWDFPNGPSWYLRCEEDGRVVLFHPEDLSLEFLDSLTRDEDEDEDEVDFWVPLGVPESEQVLTFRDVFSVVAWLGASSSDDERLTDHQGMDWWEARLGPQSAG